MNQFQVIYASPPFEGTKNVTEELTINQICEIPVKNLAAKDAVLVLWTPENKITDAFKVINAWGFKQKHLYIWVKTKKEPLKDLYNQLVKLIKSDLKNNSIPDMLFNLKNTIMFFDLNKILYTKQPYEIALVATKGKINSQILDKNQKSILIHEYCGKQFRMPEEIQDSLEKKYPGKKIELFAKRTRPGWVCLGKEADGKDIINSTLDIIFPLRKSREAGV